MKSQIIFEYIKVFIWPFVLFFFMLFFQSGIKDFISRLNKFKGPGFSAEAEGQKDLQSNQSSIKKELIKEDRESLSRELFFERIYNIIFGSQITLLNSLLTLQGGAFRLFLENHFTGIKSIYPIVYVKWTLENYISFLLLKDLITVKLESGGIQIYNISDKGKEFLSYITTRGYPKNKMW